MIDTQTPPPPSEVRRTVPAAIGATAPREAASWDFFLGTVVVVLGIVLGAVAAVFIGLVTGWIEFRC